MGKNIEEIISVIIPMYNSQSTIGNVIQCIQAQTAYQMIYEIIVVDDGSTDNSYNIVEKMQKTDKKIKLYHKRNGGAASSRNFGMSKARSKWIAFCDSDDYWLPEKISIQMSIINEHTEIDFLGGRWLDKNPHIFFREINKLYKASLYDICITFFPQPSTVIMRKEIFDEIGGFKDNQRYAEEGDYFFRICRKYQYWYTPEKLINFGDGKIGFGENGLSGHLKEMYEGNVSNIYSLYCEKAISRSFYLFLRLYYWMKYVRRIILTEIRKKKKSI